MSGGELMFASAIFNAAATYGDIQTAKAEQQAYEYQLGNALYVNNIMRSHYRELHNDILQGITGAHNTSDQLIPIELTISIEGIGGIFPGNVFQTSHIPKDYIDKTVFQAVEVNHLLDDSGWTVAIKGMMRLSYIEKYGKKYKELLEKLREADKHLDFNE